MNNYVPPYTITNEMLLRVASITEKVGSLSSLKGLEAKPHLRKQRTIHSIYATLRIEANSLGLREVTDVIDGHLVWGNKREIQEVKNAYEAYSKMDAWDPFSLEDLLKAHGIMTHLLETEAGVFRRGAEGVERNGSIIFLAPPSSMVPTLMSQLFRWMKENQGKVHPLVMAAVFHYEFIFIHPFSDGNGRMARLWHTLILEKWRSLFAYLPLESQIEHFQEKYDETIQLCHQEGSSTAFILFMLDLIESSIVNLQTKEIDDLSDYVKRLLDAMDSGVSYSLSILMHKVGLKSRSSFLKNYLTPALRQSLVQRTIPEKPNSRNQRYRKT